MAVESPRLSRSDALLAVDVQRDFCPGGALAIPQGDAVVEVLNDWLRAAADAGASVIASRDWHPPHHISFAERGGRWPEHCVRDTAGAAFHPRLMLPAEVHVLSKGQERERDAYSAFDGTELEALLRQRAIRRLFVGGLAQDVCVRATVLDALRLGFETHLLRHATRPVDADAGAQALREMQAAGAKVVSGPAASSQE